MIGVRRSRRIAWSLVGVTVAILVAAIVFLILSIDTPLPEESFAFRGSGVLVAGALAAAGVLIATRVSSNPIGWLLLAASVGAAIQELAGQYSNFGIYDSPGAVPAAAVAAWLPEWIWIPYMAAIAFFVPLLYPDGRLLSPRWRPVLIGGTIAAALGTAAFAVAPGELSSSPGVRNPAGIEGAPWLSRFGDVAMLVFVAALLSAIASLGVRFRRSRGDERQQLKWLLLALAFLAVAFTFGIPYWILGGQETSLDLLENLVVLAIVAIPFAIGAAILKYRLYDIDLVIRKTLVYGVLAVLLFALGIPLVWLFGGIVVALIGGNDAYAYLAGGIVVGAAVWPLRRVATRIADRLVFGGHATPYQVLTEFSERVAGTYAADDVLERMAQVLASGVGAASATVWLRGRDGFHAGAVWPPDGPRDGALPDDAVEVRHRDELLGAVSVRMPANDPMTSAKERLIRDLAGQAGLVLRNATLIEDLKTSRQRLVAAQDEERRRLERNIHDGAQQQLIALALKLKLTDSLVGKDDERAHAMLGELKAETNQALEDLRDLARGIYPPLLADRGLGAALESQARKSAVPVRVETDGIGRYPPEAEAAVYFSCLEALQNVAKYAEAGGATVRLSHTDGVLAFEVTDDGRGFDPAAARHGSGLQGMADRLAALGGELRLRSSPGEGTTIRGRLPVEAAR